MESARTVGRLTGPITGGAHGWPFAAAGPGRLPEGYIEEEYFLEGDAMQYALAPGGEYAHDGRWDVTEREPSRFRTRFVVRRPIDPARFSGTVVVHWNNVSLGFDYLGRLSDQESEVIASGNAWVGASVQKVGLDGLPDAEARGLRRWDPERYGTLSILHDDASFDIFTQIADAVGPGRAGATAGGGGGGGDDDDDGVDPMGGLAVERLLAVGESQSACRLATYYNAIQPVTQRFDGFLLIVYAGGGTRIEAAGPGPALEAIPDELRSVINILPFGSHLLRPDLAAPVLVLNSETEVLWYQPARQPDTSNHRLWEVAGTAHLDGGFGAGIEGEWQRDFGEVVSIPLIEAVAGPPNTLSYDSAANAALRHLWSWMRDGVVPPEQDRLELSAEELMGGQLELVRDKFGNAEGGIRLPDFAVPTATHVGESVGSAPDLAGTSTPFSPERLRELYPDHAAYVERYNRAVDEGLVKGFLLEEDAQRLRAKAAAAPVP
jgi:Alpha/beta hydrolase domain